jgi:prepilin-type N-terminal cleavage/methylation domain-containing protein
MERRNSEEANESGFTLIELLIVIVVLGILAAIVVFSLTGVSGQSKQAACTSDAKSVEVAVDAYMAANSGALPTQAQLTTGTVTYLHSWPSKTNGYDISIDSTSPTDVDVSPYANGPDVNPPGPTAFDDSAGCTSTQVAS